MYIGRQERHAFEGLHRGGMAKRAWAFLLLRLLFCLAVLASCAGPAATQPTPGQPSATPAPGDIQHSGLVGQLSGNTLRAVAVQGRYAYVSTGDELTVLDLQDPSNPRRVGRLLLPHGVGHIAAADHCLYLAGRDGLRIVDVADPARPVLVGDYPEPYVDRVVVSGRYAYLSGASLRILDVTEPLSPVEAGRFGLSGPEGPTGSVAAVAGGYAYTVYTRPRSEKSPAGGLRIVDVSNPAQPVEVGHLLLEQPIIDLAVAGSHAYLLSGAHGYPGSGWDWGRLRVVDLSDPQSPREVALEHAAEWHGQRLAAAGRYLYLVRPAPDGQTAALTVLDVADPGRPVAVAGHEGLQPPITAAALAGERLYLATGGGLAIVDVARPTAPVGLGMYRRETGLERPLAADGVALAGRYVGVAAGESGLLVVDLADPADPTIAGALDTAGHAWDVALAHGYAYVADEHGGLRVVDVRDPSQPREVGVCDPPGQADFFHGVAVAGRYACVADGGMPRTGLRVIDIVDPTQPREVAFLPLAGEGEGPYAPRAEGVAVADGLVYLAGGTAGLRVIDLADPAAPREIGAYDTPGRADNVAVAGRYAYLVDGDLRIVDLADPRRPAEVGFVDLPDGSTQAFVAARGSRVYVTGAGLQVLDVSDPARPVLLAQHEVPGGDVAVAGELACVVGPGVYVLGIAR
jgi:hypothetical protein